MLLDGSLIGGTVANPGSFVKKIINNAAKNGNSIAAISKSTGLVLQRSLRHCDVCAAYFATIVDHMFVLEFDPCFCALTVTQRDC
jgi:hypothetical protein